MEVEIENYKDNKELEKAQIENKMIEDGIDLNLEEKNFFDSTLGKIVNTGLDMGIRAVLPGFVEDQVIEIKNIIINEGFKQGLEMSINSCKEIGKSFKGIVTGKFDTIEEIDIALKKDGLLDNISKGIDNSLKIATSAQLLDKNVSKLIKASKNVIIENVSNKIGEGLKSEIRNIEKLKEYVNKWEDAYRNKDFDKMKKAYTFVKKYSEKIIPIQDIINRSNEVENIQTLLQNNGQKFDFSEEQKELLKTLSNT